MELNSSVLPSTWHRLRHSFPSTVATVAINAGHGTAGHGRTGQSHSHSSTQHPAPSTQHPSIRCNQQTSLAMSPIREAVDSCFHPTAFRLRCISSISGPRLLPSAQWLTRMDRGACLVGTTHTHPPPRSPASKHQRTDLQKKWSTPGCLRGRLTTSTPTPYPPPLLCNKRAYMRTFVYACGFTWPPFTASHGGWLNEMRITIRRRRIASFLFCSMASHIQHVSGHVGPRRAGRSFRRRREHWLQCS